MALGYVYPTYECFKIVEKKRPDLEHLRIWCQYWMIIAVVTVLERLADILISWVPMYSEAKLAFIIYLWYPKTMGTTYVYKTLLRPFVAKHESEIDRNLNELRTRAGDMAVFWWQRGSFCAQAGFYELLQYVASQSNRSQKASIPLPVAPHQPPPPPHHGPPQRGSQKYPQQPSAVESAPGIAVRAPEDGDGQAYPPSVLGAYLGPAPNPPREVAGQAGQGLYPPPIPYSYGPILQSPGSKGRSVCKIPFDHDVDYDGVENSSKSQSECRLTAFGGQNVSPQTYNTRSHQRASGPW